MVAILAAMDTATPLLHRHFLEQGLINETRHAYYEITHFGSDVPRAVSEVTMGTK